MANYEKIQKKRSPFKAFLDNLFKILIFIAIIIFIYIALTKVDFNTGKMDFAPKKDVNEGSSPSSLRWFDDFKGVENVPSKKQLEERKKAEEEKKAGSATGFNFRGFK